jgi:hypothetical protein
MKQPVSSEFLVMESDSSFLWLILRRRNPASACRSAATLGDLPADDPGEKGNFSGWYGGIVRFLEDQYNEEILWEKQLTGPRPDSPFRMRQDTRG